LESVDIGCYLLRARPCSLGTDISIALQIYSHGPAYVKKIGRKMHLGFNLFAAFQPWAGAYSPDLVHEIETREKDSAIIPTLKRMGTSRIILLDPTN